MYGLIYLCLIALVSIVALVTYFIDKNMAKGGTEKRIKEKTLLGLAVFGGALGSFVGRIICHHKTNKIYFSIVIYLALAIQVGLAALAVYSIIKNGGIL
ncbi:MAG: DUF1294 domain-containing protein [Bacilli bacterium]|nr:DUF1294 domain-containing protein [Bacilli bacterium]